MFTGIISHLGRFSKRDKTTYFFEAEKDFLNRIERGTSISVSGACLTVVNKNINTFCVEVMPETQSKTMLGSLVLGSVVNLELPVTPNTFLSGHMVSGHVDGLGKVASIIKRGNSFLIKIEIPTKLSKFLVQKGSVAVNGISLTIIEARDRYFTIGIIPFTWKNTMLNGLKVRDEVNIETDMMAKYIAKLVNR